MTHTIAPGLRQLFVSQSASATFCSAAHSNSACAICTANLENFLKSTRCKLMFVFRNSPTMNRYFLLRFWLLVYFAAPGSFESSTDRCFCEVSTVFVADLPLFLRCWSLKRATGKAAGPLDFSHDFITKTFFLDFVCFYAEGQCVNIVG